MSDRCAWPRCPLPIELIYCGKPLCDKHWEMVASEDPRAEARARKKVGLPPKERYKPPTKAKEPEPAPLPVTPDPVASEEEEDDFDLEQLAGSLMGGAYTDDD